MDRVGKIIIIGLLAVAFVAEVYVGFTSDYGDDMGAITGVFTLILAFITGWLTIWTWRKWSWVSQNFLYPAVRQGPDYEIRKRKFLIWYFLIFLVVGAYFIFFKD